MKRLLTLFGANNGTSEQSILEKGRKMIERTFEEQKAFGLKLQDRYENLTNADILTTALPFRDDIPQQYKDRIHEYRVRVKEIIFGVAAELQDQKFNSLDQDVKSAGLSKFQERRYIKVRDAQKELYASYDAIRESLNYISDFNNHILKRITESSGPRKTDLLLLNAIIIYELTDAIVELIRDFQLRGKDTLRSINDQVIAELLEQQSHDEALWKRTTESDGQVQQGVRRSIEERYKIREIVAKKWEKIWDQVGELETNIAKAQGYLSTLELIRDNARGQINILEVIGITQIVESNLRNFQEICAVTNIELAPLTKEDVYGLIGRIDQSIQTEQGAAANP